MTEPLIDASARSPRHLEVDVGEELDAVRSAPECVDHVDHDGVLGARIRRDVGLVLVLELLFEARSTLAEGAVVVLSTAQWDRDTRSLPGAAGGNVAARRLEPKT